MKRFYAFMLAMVLIVSSFVFSACSTQNEGADAGNGTASDQTQHNDNAETGNGNGSSSDVSGTEENKVDNTNKDNTGADNNVVEEFGDDVERTVDDVVDAGQR